MGIGEKVAKSVMIIMVFTLLSKVLGFIREILIAARFGSGAETDAFFIALTACTILTSVAGAAIKTTLIPVITEVEESLGRKKQNAFSGWMTLIIMGISILASLLGILFAPLIIRILATGFEGEQFDLTVRLTRIGYPMIVFLTTNFVLHAYLNHHENFFLPAFVGVPFNLVYIMFLLGFSDFGITGLMVAGLVASFIQVLIKIPKIRRLGITVRPEFREYRPYIQKVFLLMGPVIIGTMAHHVNTVVDRTLASTLVEGSVSALNYAAKLNSLFLSVFVLAVVTVIFPLLSKETRKEDKTATLSIMTGSLNTIAIIVLPIMVGVMILAEPMIYLFFERGEFDERATMMTATAFRFYIVGLIGFSFKDIVSRVFYSMQDTKTPMILGIVAVTVNIILNFILIGPLAHGGLALATGISGILSSVLLIWSLHRKMGHINGRRLFTCLLKSGVSALVMAPPVYIFYRWASASFSEGRTQEALALFGAIGIGMVVYFTVSIALKTEETLLLISTLKGKILRRGK